MLRSQTDGAVRGADRHDIGWDTSTHNLQASWCLRCRTAAVPQAASVLGIAVASICCSSCLACDGRRSIDCPNSLRSKTAPRLVEPGRAVARGIEIYARSDAPRRHYLVPAGCALRLLENDVQLAHRCCGIDAIHDLANLDPATSFLMRRKHHPGRDSHRLRTAGRARAASSRGFARSGICRRAESDGLGASQGLGSRLFVHACHRWPASRRDGG